MNNEELFNQDAELAVLSILLKNTELVYKVPNLKSNMLSSVQNALIYNELLELTQLNLSPDQTMLVGYMQKKGTLERAGGKEYIKYIYSLNYSADNISGYVNIIVDSYKARSLLSMATRLPSMLTSAENVDLLISQVKNTVENLSFTGSGESITSVSDCVSSVWDNIAARIEGTATLGVSTGFKRLDYVTGGFNPGDLWYIAARPGMGKSAWMLNSVVNTARNGIASIVFSLEMDKASLIERMLSIITGVSLINIRLGSLDNKEIDSLKSALALIKSLPIYIDTSTTGDVSYITSVIRKYNYNSNVRLVFVDYVQLLAERGQDATNELGRISRQMKLISRDLGVTSVVLSQVNRGVESRDDKRPIMSDLRQSGNLEEDADLLGVLYRDDFYNKETAYSGIMEFIIRKHRNGPTGTLSMNFTPDTNNISED